MPSSDRLTALLTRFRISTSLFHTGALSGVTNFPPQPGRGYLHVLRRGALEVTYLDDRGKFQRASVERPTVLFFPRPVTHTFHNAPETGSDFTCAAVDVSDGNTHPIFQALPSALLVPLEDAPCLAPALDLLLREADQAQCGHHVVVDRLFEVVLIQLLRWILDHVDQLGIPTGLFTGLADPQLTPALNAVHKSPGSTWTLENMAEAANMSRSVFAARFKHVLGITPGEYLTQWRLTVAQYRLQEGATVAEAARELGYRLPSSFSRVFAQHLGTSPRHWLRSQRDTTTLV